MAEPRKRKPHLTIAAAQDLRTEQGMLNFFRRLVGREPTEEEIAELRAEMARNPLPAD